MVAAHVVDVVVERMKKMNKIIAIDASSNAIGWAFWNDKVLIHSGSVHVDNSKDVGSDRVVEILKKFAEMWNNLPKEIKQGTETVVMNTGFAQGNDIDAGLRYLRRVQQVLCYELCDKLNLSESPVLDISWLNALAEFVGWTGNVNNLKIRKNKKRETVRAAVKIKHGLNYLITDFKSINKEFYKYELNGKTYVMSDDEADGIFCGWSYQYGKVSRQTLLNRKEKNRLERANEVLNKAKKLKKENDMLAGHIEKIKDEIKEIKLKPDSKTKVKSLEAREIKINFKSDKISENKEMMRLLKKEHDKIKGEE